MNYYIIFTPNISGIGGAELYIKNKCMYLKENNWEPLIITSNDDNIKIEELLSIKALSIKELNSPVYYYNIKYKNKILKKITDWINAIRVDDSRIVIESHNLYPCTWAETISEIYTTINIVYFLAEENVFKLSPTYYEFILHKINQRQFVTVCSKSSEIMFGFKDSEKFKVPYVNVPFSLKEFQKNKSNDLNRIVNEINNENNSIVILTVSRLEKPYIKTLINEVYKVANKTKQKICLIVVGDSSQEGLLCKYIDEYEINNSDIMIKFTGYIYPLFEELFIKSDIFVGMGTAIINAASVGCPAICVDPRTNMASGIFGLDLDNFAYPNTLSETSISEEILHLIGNKELGANASQLSKIIYEKEYDYESVMIKFMKIVYEQLGENENQYFKFKLKFSGIKEFLRYLFSKSVGIKYYVSCAKIIKRLFNN